MKKIINQKLYDTKTAQEIHSEWNGLSSSDHNYSSEELYRTRKGEYFLYGDGGAHSKYGESVGNNSLEPGSAIIPLSDEEAFDWLESVDAVLAIEKYFSEYVTEA